ncbi:MAG: hypothetical protein NC079_09740 [Clostridium sp.]|nr:hypothetical protein [Acetatifactor muris]MCM1527780.1 hypothetical protein [Bacteroides sp.]MCM1563875.1 hypothetical protein [Clostridium sp.]
MDKYEYKVRAEEIKELIAQGNFGQAAEIADTIDWRRVKSVMMLCTISDLYKINRRYEDARDLLLLAYERRPGGRNICYSLCELSIKTGELVQAMEYYKEFVQVAPKDPGCYILKYKLYENQEVSLEERIEVLEELKKCEYREKWAYELAYLYHRVGLATRCVEECDEMILWFGEGEYVIKAMELKMLHQPLSPEQQEKYDHRFDAPYMDDAQEESFDEHYADGSELFYDESAAEDEVYGVATNGTEGVSGDTQIYEPYRGQDFEPETVEVFRQKAPARVEEPDIHVKTMDVGQYNTLNLQAELAQGLQELLDAEQENAGQGIDNPITRSIVAPMVDSDTESLDYPEIDMVSEEDLDSEYEEIEESEVFFGETGEIVLEQMRREGLEEAAAAANGSEAGISADPADESRQESVKVVSGDEEQIPGVKQVVYPVHRDEERMAAVEPPRELANVLSQEPDGQISLVVPEWEKVEKQITGQLDIQDVLAEWERMKLENEEKRKEDVRQRVLQQTGNMFTEFDAAVRDGLLEQLEKSAAQAEDSQTEDLQTEDSQTEDPQTEDSRADDLETDNAGMDVFDTDEVEELEELEEPEESVEPADPVEISESAESEEIQTQEDSDELFNFVEIKDADTMKASADAQNRVSEESGEMPEEPDEISDETKSDILSETTDDVPDGEREETRPEGETDAQPEEREEEPPVAQGKTRSMTREEKELYAAYIQSRSTKEQIVYAVDNISLAAYTGNIVITGGEGMDTISLAKKMIKEVQITDSNFSGRVAKISGQGLNGRDVDDVLNQLQNGALIVQDACGMNEDTVKDLYQALQKENLGIVILLQDETKAMDRFLSRNDVLLDVFTARVDVETLSNDLLVAYGKKYAKEQEYSIDELGILALHNRIEQRQTLDHAVTTAEVQEIVNEAIRHANRKTPGHFFDILLAKRYDEEDMIVVTEKDFARV